MPHKYYYRKLTGILSLTLQAEATFSQYELACKSTFCMPVPHVSSDRENIASARRVTVTTL